MIITFSRKLVWVGRNNEKHANKKTNVVSVDT